MSFIISLTGEFGRQNRCFIQRDRVADVVSNMNERRLPMSVISTCKTNTDITAACPMAGADSVICEGVGAGPSRSFISPFLPPLSPLRRLESKVKLFYSAP